MTKMQMMRKVSEIHKEALTALEPRLEALYTQEIITAGAYYYLYTPTCWDSWRQLDNLYTRANKAKDYYSYLINRDTFTYTYMLECAKKDYAEALAFIETTERA